MYAAAWYQDNEYILSSYRHVSGSYTRSLKSLSGIHNETGQFLKRSRNTIPSSNADFSQHLLPSHRLRPIPHSADPSIHFPKPTLWLSLNSRHRRLLNLLLRRRNLLRSLSNVCTPNSHSDPQPITRLTTPVSTSSPTTAHTSTPWATNSTTSFTPCLPLSLTNNPSSASSS